MRVLVCKIHWPFICFCKPSAAAAAAAHHLYSSGPLKLENTPPLPSASSTVASLSENTSAQLSAVTEISQVKDQNSHSDGKVHVENEFKSCIRKAPAAPAAVKSTKSKRVQWIDNIGKELAEIKEFESCEAGDTDNEEDNRGCMCIIV